MNEVSEPWSLTLELGRVRDFWASTFSSAQDPKLGAPIPPTFLTTAVLCWQPADQRLHAQLGFDFSRSLHAEEEYEFYGAPPVVGEVLTACSTVEPGCEKLGKRSGRLRFAVVRTDFFRDGAVVATQRMTLVERSTVSD
jgi:hypothetical protein